MRRSSRVSGPFAHVFAWTAAGAVASASGAAIVTVGFGIATTAALPACNARESEGGAANCASVTPNQGTGETACNGATCAASTYCVSDSGSGGCLPGCMTTVQCPNGEYCDLSNAQPDIAGNTTGTCAQPSLQQQSAVCSPGGDSGSGSPKDGGRD